ncbi:C-Maf-inducing protein-like [Copidosoma floridanum]|uniref:C-Maf-inducing protein-like n=1 Tax=Copidosoma floridanum TaxID=29053 RepID=UPI0006C9CAD7|nr:C-Maf-inducing protein-like [Copidosoma floridanum]
MYCFQNPFSRATRSVVTNPLAGGGTKCTSKPKRRNSEAASEGDSGSSSIRYIDQLSEASSTDTLPGIRSDYLDAELLSPGPDCLASPTIVFTSEPPVPGNGLEALTPTDDDDDDDYDNDNDNGAEEDKPGCGWRRKLLLKLRSSESSNSSHCNSSASPSEENLAPKTSPPPPPPPPRADDAGNGCIGNGNCLLASSKHRQPGYSNGSTSMLLGASERDEPSEDEDEDYDDAYNLEETEPEDNSSLPSSPAAPATVGLATGGPMPSYYGFLSVGGAALRHQENTSTSSPQLSSADALEHALVNGGGSIGGGGGGGGCLMLLDETSSLREEKRASSNETVSLKSHHLKPEPGLEASVCLPVARSCPNLERQSAGCSSASGSSSPVPSPGPAGPRFKPIEEGDIQVCSLNHTRTLVSKILSSRFLRRWETHHLYLNDACLSSKTLTGFFQQPVPYSSMTEVYAVERWDPTYKYCLRIVLPDGSLLLQASNAYTRDQWYYSILWKKSIFRYQKVMVSAIKEEIVLRELKSLVDFALWTPLQDERVAGVPLEAVAKLLEEPPHLERCLDYDKKKLDDDEVENNEKTGDQEEEEMDGPLIITGLSDEDEEEDESEREARCWAEAVLGVAGPLLERAAPPVGLARALARLARRHPRSSIVQALRPAVTRCLKHTVDFGKSPDMRRLLQVFVAALHEAVDGERALRDYIASVHGPGSDCPHPRVLPNLVSICVAAIFHRFEVSSCKHQQPEEGAPTSLPPLRCYLLVLNIASEYSDWRPGLGALLQPVPFPEDALANKEVQDSVISCVMHRLAKDPRCTVHRVLLPVREPRPGWIHIAAPSSPACPDDGQIFGEMLTTLLACCCRRKRFISSLLKQTGGACVLLGVRGCDAAQEALCLMLEWRLLPNEEARLQVVSALQSTESGKTRYAALCQRQKNLQELQQKGGPRKLTLPVRATDADVALLLGNGALGNLECLSLAFTSVTSACAEQLIKLPALRYLNLWATQFGDTGLQMISEHLQKLQVLNLCETPVSDKGISTLASLTNLRKLNLNSTKLSASTFEALKKQLPSLQEFDVRYTEAW